MPSGNTSTADRLRHAVQLTRDRRLRDSTGTFLVQGVRNVVSAFDSGFSFESVFACKILLRSATARGLLRRLDRAVPIHRVPPERFRELCLDQRASGIAAVLKQRTREIAPMRPSPGDCWLVLSRVRSPGNLGCLLRTCTAVRASGLILVGELIDPYAPAVVRASMGALYRQPIVRTDWHELSRWSREHRLQTVAASGDGSRSYSDFSYRKPVLVLLGDERKGLDTEQRRFAENLVHIPMAPEVDSLNVSVAGAILLYEIDRQTMPNTT